MSCSPPIEGFASRRLLMRPWQHRDQDAYHRIFGDLRVVWWLSQPPTREATRAGLQRAIDKHNTPRRGLGRFALVSKQSRAIVGNLMLCPAGFGEGIEVGYHIAHEHWGCGYATEAARQALLYGFGQLGLQEIIAAVALTNQASLTIMKKLGMGATHEAEHAGLAHRMFICRAPQASCRSISSCRTR